jgi:hypothetical protein
MQVTKSLSPEYELYERVRVDKWKSIRLVQLFIGVVILWVSYKLLHLFALFLRPEYQPKPPQIQSLSLELFILIFSIAIPTIIVLSIHEFIHALILKIYTGQWPRVKASWDGISVQNPKWYIPRNHFLLISLAPVFILTNLGLLLIPFIPQKHISLLVFLVSINIGASYADITSSTYLFLHSPFIYVETKGKIYFNKTFEINVPEWKKRIRTSIETFIAKLDPLPGSG